MGMAITVELSSYLIIVGHKLTNRPTAVKQTIMGKQEAVTNIDTNYTDLSIKIIRDWPHQVKKVSLTKWFYTTTVPSVYFQEPTYNSVLIHYTV